MKKLSYIKLTLSIALAALLSFSCEKDDICTEGTVTTPSLIIDFFDAANTTEDVAKTVTDLRIIPVGDYNTAIAITNVTATSVRIPLRTQSDVTSYRFILGYEEDSMGNQTAGNEDIITFNYTTQEIFLSRACGYITNYTLNNTDGAVITADSDNWVNPTTGLQIINSSIQNETAAHVKIYH